MSHSEAQTSIDLDPDWGKAFEQYENVMSSGTEAMRIKAMSKLAHLCKHAPEVILARTIPILAEILCDVPSNISNQPIQEAALYCLGHIARQGNGALATGIGQYGVIKSILRFLPHSDNGFQRVMMKCLWILVTFGKKNREVLAGAGGLEIILSMLNLHEDGIRRYSLEILSALALLREVRRVLTSLGGLRFLVEAASCGSMVSRERACQAIGLLGVTRRARRLLVELGVIPVLIDFFRNGDSKAKLVAGNSLGMISAHVQYIRPVAQAGAIPLFAELLRGPEPVGKEIAEDVFCILAVAEVNAVEISEYLVAILREGDDEAKAAAADVLWDLSSYKHSVSVVQNSGAIPLLVELLRDGDSGVGEKVSGAIAQLSYAEADRVALANEGVIPLLIDLLQANSEEVRDNVAEALVNFSEDPLYCDRISEVIDLLSFENMQNRLIRIRASDEHMTRSLRRMSIEQLTRESDLI
ncbi:U-box domain-containing protein 4 [Morella rubra]|uniref:U-box domain-containing protein 4 n=1 Tax=Morella rubra TaxID=262757 RepID=A0A6A1UFK5_9ROSI|nr:U-box domain-containing protein 4 [Morella rubra]